MKKAIVAAFAAAGILAFGSPAGAPTATTRPATPTERSFCQANYDLLGPITEDCSQVPLSGSIEEDDPWGRWDCRTMGNMMCGELIYFNIGGQLHSYGVNAPNRPACIVEPSNTREGYEVIFYMDMAKWGGEFGFEVNCPR